MKLLDVCDFQGGSQPPKNEWSNEEKDGFVRMLQIRDFTQESRVTPEFVKKTNRLKYCETDDILIGRYGASVGKILTGKSGAYNVAIMKSIPDTSKVRKQYMKYYFSSPNFQNYLLSLGGRAAQAGFSKDDLAKLDFNLVDFKTQDKAISEFSSLEQVLTLKQNELSLLDELIKSRFIEMFMSNQKDRYPLMKWKDIVSVKHGKDYKKNLVESGGYPVYGSGGFMGIYANNYLVNENATIIGRKGTIDKPIFVKEKFWNVDTAFGIEVNKEYLNPVFFYVRSTLYDLKSMSTSTTLPSMTQSTLHNIDIGVPPIELQNEFAVFVKQVDKSKFVIQQQIKDLQELLDKKMDEYFSE